MRERLKAHRSGMLEAVDSEPVLPAGRRQEIDARLAAVRARLETLRQRDRGWESRKRPAATPEERLAAAKRHAAEAHAAAAEVLASSAEAFRHAAQAHERAAGIHEQTAVKGIGDVPEHQRQAAHHRAAAAADWQRAERAQSLISDHARTRPAPPPDEPPDGMPA